jgi:phage-related protein
MDFPNIASPDLGIVESVEDSEIGTPTEAGYEQTRPRFTRDRHTWKLFWEQEPLSVADYNTLMAFRADVRGGQAFNWTHPFTHTPYVVRAKFGEFRLTEAGGIPGYAGSITLREV